MNPQDRTPPKALPPRVPAVEAEVERPTKAAPLLLHDRTKLAEAHRLLAVERRHSKASRAEADRLRKENGVMKRGVAELRRRLAKAKAKCVQHAQPMSLAATDVEQDVDASLSEDDEFWYGAVFASELENVKHAADTSKSIAQEIERSSSSSSVASDVTATPVAAAAVAAATSSGSALPAGDAELCEIAALRRRADNGKSMVDAAKLVVESLKSRVAALRTKNAGLRSAQASAAATLEQAHRRHGDGLARHARAHAIERRDGAIRTAGIQAQLDALVAEREREARSAAEDALEPRSPASPNPRAAAREDEARALAAECDHLRAAARRCDREAETHTAAAAAAQRKCAKLSDEVEALHVALDAQRDAAAQRSDGHAVALSTLRRESSVARAQLERQCAQLRAVHDDAAQRVGALKRTVAALRSALEHERVSAAGLGAAHAAASAELHELRRARVCWSDAMAALQRTHAAALDAQAGAAAVQFDAMCARRVRVQAEHSAARHARGAARHASSAAAEARRAVNAAGVAAAADGAVRVAEAEIGALRAELAREVASAKTECKSHAAALEAHEVAAARSTSDAMRAAQSAHEVATRELRAEHGAVVSVRVAAAEAPHVDALHAAEQYHSARVIQLTLRAKRGTAAAARAHAAALDALAHDHAAEAAAATVRQRRERHARGAESEARAAEAAHAQEVAAAAATRARTDAAHEAALAALREGQHAALADLESARAAHATRAAQRVETRALAFAVELRATKRACALECAALRSQLDTSHSAKLLCSAAEFSSIEAERASVQARHAVCVATLEAEAADARGRANQLAALIEASRTRDAEVCAQHVRRSMDLTVQLEARAVGEGALEAAACDARAQGAVDAAERDALATRCAALESEELAAAQARAVLLQRLDARTAEVDDGRCELAALRAALECAADDGVRAKEELGVLHSAVDQLRRERDAALLQSSAASFVAARDLLAPLEEAETQPGGGSPAAAGEGEGAWGDGYSGGASSRCSSIKAAEGSIPHNESASVAELPARGRVKKLSRVLVEMEALWGSLLRARFAHTLRETRCATALDALAVSKERLGRTASVLSELVAVHAPSPLALAPDGGGECEGKPAAPPSLSSLLTALMPFSPFAMGGGGSGVERRATFTLGGAIGAAFSGCASTSAARVAVPIPRSVFAGAEEYNPHACAFKAPAAFEDVAARIEALLFVFAMALIRAHDRLNDYSDALIQPTLQKMGVFRAQFESNEDVAVSATSPAGRSEPEVSFSASESSESSDGEYELSG